ncbi:MAG: ferredoxin [Actinomycetota bacterium]|nr:ferredoxin [Actinomycetota bacterium]
MKLVVDLNKCADHGQCVFAAPDVFELDDRGELSFRRLAKDIYVSGELDESLRNSIEEAADICPSQAIEIED